MVTPQSEIDMHLNWRELTTLPDVLIVGHLREHSISPDGRNSFPHLYEVLVSTVNAHYAHIHRKVFTTAQADIARKKKTSSNASLKNG